MYLICNVGLRSNYSKFFHLSDAAATTTLYQTGNEEESTASDSVEVTALATSPSSFSSPPTEEGIDYVFDLRCCKNKNGSYFTNTKS